MESRTYALIAGIFVAVFMAAALGMLWWFGGSRDSVRDIVLVSTHSVTGLNSQAAVRYRGVRIGKVSSIGFDPNESGAILVNIEVAKNVAIPERSVSRLAYQGLTGQAFILIDDAPHSIPLVQDGGPLRLTLQPSYVSEGIDNGMELLRQLKETTTRVNALLADDNRKKVSHALDNVERLTGNVAAASQRLPETLDRLHRLVSDENLARLNTVLGNAADASGQASGVMQDSRQLVAGLRQVTERLDRVLEKAEKLDAAALADTPGRVNDVVEQVGQTVANLDRLLRTLEESPQSVVYGRPPRAPGPGEAGFAAPKGGQK